MVRVAHDQAGVKGSTTPPRSLVLGDVQQCRVVRKPDEPTEAAQLVDRRIDFPFALGSQMSGSRWD